MKLHPAPSGWLVEPESSDERAHLAYVLNALADRRSRGGVSTTEGAVPANHLQQAGQTLHTAGSAG